MKLQYCDVYVGYSSAAKDRGDNSDGQRQECGKDGDGASNITRTDSPDNDSAFSDTVSTYSLISCAI